MVIAGYPVVSYKDYDYMRLFDGNFIRKSNAGHYQSFYEKIITVDTETYVSDNEDIGWITDWTITIEMIAVCMVIMYVILSIRLTGSVTRFMLIKNIQCDFIYITYHMTICFCGIIY